jgi:hypothetical protein
METKNGSFRTQAKASQYLDRSKTHCYWLESPRYSREKSFRNDAGRIAKFSKTAERTPLFRIIKTQNGALLAPLPLIAENKFDVRAPGIETGLGTMSSLGSRYVGQWKKNLFPLGIGLCLPAWRASILQLEHQRIWRSFGSSSRRENPSWGNNAGTTTSVPPSITDWQSQVGSHIIQFICRFFNSRSHHCTVYRSYRWCLGWGGWNGMDGMGGNQCAHSRVITQDDSVILVRYSQLTPT